MRCKHSEGVGKKSMMLQYLYNKFTYSIVPINILAVPNPDS